MTDTYINWYVFLQKLEFMYSSRARVCARLTFGFWGDFVHAESGPPASEREGERDGRGIS